MRKNFYSLLFFVILFAVFTGKAYASLSYKLIAPDGTLQSGDNVQFTITIDTQGDKITTTQIGMTYDTQYLQYVSAAPSNTVDSISVTESATGKLVLTGTSGSGFSGSGTFALITFKIIATGSGSTQLCTLVPTSPTSTPPSSTPPASTSQPVYATTVPKKPLPTSGISASGTTSFLGLGLVIIALAIFIINKNVFIKKSKSS